MPRRDVCADPLPFSEIAILLQGITDREALSATAASLKTWCDPVDVDLVIELLSIMLPIPRRERPSVRASAAPN